MAEDAEMNKVHGFFLQNKWKCLADSITLQKGVCANLLMWMKIRVDIADEPILVARIWW